MPSNSSAGAAAPRVFKLELLVMYILNCMHMYGIYIEYCHFYNVVIPYPPVNFSDSKPGGNSWVNSHSKAVILLYNISFPHLSGVKT